MMARFETITLKGKAKNGVDLTGFVQDKEILHLNYSEAPYQCKDSGLQNEVIYHLAIELAICIIPT